MKLKYPSIGDKVKLIKAWHGGVNHAYTDRGLSIITSLDTGTLVDMNRLRRCDITGSDGLTRSFPTAIVDYGGIRLSLFLPSFVRA